MDFDGDGILDMISGSYNPGACYLFRGLGRGKYAARETIVDRSGKSVLLYPDPKSERHGWGCWIAMADWENDGDLDLVLGGFHGELMVRLNEGTRTEPKYVTDNLVIQIDGKDAKVPGDQPAAADHATPVVADFDGDGRWDILSGSANGAVYWFRNVGDANSPKFEPPTELVAKHQGSAWGKVLDVRTTPVPGICSQIAVTDYNRDGRLDLLVGDFCTTVSPRVDLTAAERLAMLETHKQMGEVAAQIRNTIESFRQSFLSRYPADEMSDEIEEAWVEQYLEMTSGDDFEELQARKERLGESLEAYLQKPEVQGRSYETRHGYVWLFIRRRGP